MIHLDTSVMVEALEGTGAVAAAIDQLISAGTRLAVSTLVLYEWWRGPRTDDERRVQGRLFPLDRAIVFDAIVAARAATLYRSLKRARSREIDIAIAACAIEHGAKLWTLNPEDFRDIPGLDLYMTT